METRVSHRAIAFQQLIDLLSENTGIAMTDLANFGVYVHWPFARKMPYYILTVMRYG